MNRIFAGCLALVLMAGVSLAKPRPGSAMASTVTNAPSASSAFFPTAVWYSGGKARAPMLGPVDANSAQQWGQDLDQIKRVGFNTVKTWVDWSTAEPAPGVYDFKNLNLLMKLAHQRGLRVIVQIYMDSAPDWVGQRFPDARFVDRSGAVITSQSAPGYCVDDRALRAKMVEFYVALSKDANQFPALYGWDVWSEPHIINWAEISYLKDPEFCYCRYSQERFREWLQAKYKTLDALNAAWYRRFTSWDQVQPPRFSTILSYADYLDWRAFIDDKLAEDLHTRVVAIRSADPSHPITSHADDPGLFTSPTDGYGQPDDWKMSKAADFFGTSIYPNMVHMWPDWMLASGLDFIRSAGHSYGKGFWIGELQAGQGVSGMRIAQPVTAQNEQFWLWQVLSHGAREVAVYAWYPMSSGYESGGYGLINLDGSITDRARAAGAVARVVEQNAAEINRARPATAHVAILYDRLSYMVGGTEPSNAVLAHAERDSLYGVYRAFWRDQIPIDFLNDSTLTSADLRPYKIVYLPYPVMLSSRVAEAVKQYVANGGTAVAEARLAWNDARGYASPVIPGFGLDQVFGAHETSMHPDSEPRLILQSSAGLPGLKSGDTIDGAAFEEDLQPLATASILARFSDGQPAIVENSFGHGKAILTGSFVGLAFQKEQDAVTGKFLVSLASAAGVTPEVRVSGPGTSKVEVRRLTSENEQFIFVFNHADDPANATISLRLPWQVQNARDLVSDEKLTSSEIQSSANGEETVLQKDLAPKAIWIVRLDRR
ncbi:MAG: beta-galactosidase [Acidobacteriaceae bacterium]